MVHLFAADLDVEDGGFFCDGAVGSSDVESVVCLYGDGVACDVVDDVSSCVEGLDCGFEACEFFFDIDGGVLEEFASGVRAVVSARVVRVFLRFMAVPFSGLWLLYVLCSGLSIGIG